MGELRIRAVSLDQPLRYLSGGNQQKAVLAKWLSAGSDIFLLDEPTRGVDVRSKAEIYDIIRALCARGCAVLLASSELEELMALSPDSGDAPRSNRGRAVARRSNRRTNHETGYRRSELKRVPRAILLQRFGPLLGLIILCVTLGILTDHFLTFDNLINVFRQSAVNALVSLGQLLVIITAGIDLSVGSVMGLSCVLAALMLKAGVPARPGARRIARHRRDARRRQRNASHQVAVAASLHSRHSE